MSRGSLPSTRTTYLLVAAPVEVVAREALQRVYVLDFLHTEHIAIERLDAVRDCRTVLPSLAFTSLPR